MLMKNTFGCPTTKEMLTLMLLLNVKKFCMTAACNDLPGRRQSQFCLKSQCGFCNCALPLGFLAFSSKCHGHYAILHSACSGDKHFWREDKVSCTIPPIPTPVLAVRMWKVVRPAFLLMLQPRLQVALSREFYVTPYIKSSVITDVLRLPTLQRGDNMGSCFLGNIFLVTLTLLSLAIVTCYLILFFPFIFFPPKYFTVTYKTFGKDSFKARLYNHIGRKQISLTLFILDYVKD